ncbi:cell division protein FtsN [Pectobacteriaceae bacterium CE70]|nr:cell division protein FtsN [Pectobacteriaceae bacterium C52]WJV66709.1 cell division protein FtsN [Pectobacteriaceae bacterium CE70]WJY10705.1 cell division protein FtsN [Pectobacteriaceae bacterium C80]
MAQRDYVSRGRSATRRKKTSNRRKGSSSGTSKVMIALAAAVLVTFAGGLYFIVHNKPGESPVLPHQTGKGNGLPPKPEERWRYIKELENRHIGVTTPTEPSAGGNVETTGELTQEQRQLLEQIQSDMRNQPTPLSEVPYNETQVPRSQVFIKPQEVVPPTVVPRVSTVAPSPTKPEISKPKIAKNEPEKVDSNKQKKAQLWIVQCGSFKTTEPAESVRAELAFSGIESHITSSGGWNRIILGPYNNRTNANKMALRLKGMGHTNCILLANGG